MKILKIIGLLLAIIFLLSAGFVAHLFVRFDLFFNPVVSEIRNDPKATRWGDLTTLTPTPFQLGEKREVVSEKMNRAGFKKVEGDRVWRLHQSRFNQGQEVFTREANRLPCNITVYVFMKFDDKRNLELAQGTQQEHGCL